MTYEHRPQCGPHARVNRGCSTLADPRSAGFSSSSPCAASDALLKDARADKVLVLKSERTLELLDHGRVLKKYKVALGETPMGKKQKQGDHKTPEGFYVIDHRNEHSHFYRALHISYPNADDRVKARTAGVSAGGDIMIHGLPKGDGMDRFKASTA